MTLTMSDGGSIGVLDGAVGMNVEIRTPDGRLLGTFNPVPRPGMMFPELGKTDEELDRIENDPNARWYTADEALAHIRELGGAG